MASTHDSPATGGVPQAIVILSTGLKPDTRLRVFDTDFHVHSSALKLHSAFFRTFLDSPDKATATSGSFQYTWVTKVDEDGSWSLVCGDKEESKLENSNIEAYKGDPAAETQSFTSFLCALLSRPYSIGSIAELERLTRLADFYCALPAFSNSLSTALLKSPDLASAIPANALKLLPTTVMLRNELLFKECLIHALGPWTNPQYLQLTDPKLKQTASRAFGNLSAKIVKVEGKLLAATKSIPRNPYDLSWGKNICTFITDNVSACYDWSNGALNLPHFYRQIHTRACSENVTLLKDMLSPILKNNLILDRSDGSAGNGDGQYKGFFLCIEIDDADLPWDHTQLDW